MHLLYVILRVYPFWAVPLALILAELGFYFRRKEHKAKYFCWLFAVIFLTTSVLWVVYRGDLNAKAWLEVLL